MDIFSYSVIIRIMNDDFESYSINEYKEYDDWSKWKEAIQTEFKTCGL